MCLMCFEGGVALESDLQEGWDLMLSKLAYIDSLSESAHSTVKHTSILQGKLTEKHITRVSNPAPGRPPLIKHSRNVFRIAGNL